MTQVKGAQQKGEQLARYTGSDHRNLASRRAAFAAQMRDMALSDLKQVSKRLKGLHRELEEKEARRWTHYDLAREMGIRPRTFQSWENGEVENSNGKGYDKMARYYSRKLGRKVTRKWILFGDGEAAEPLPQEDVAIPADFMERFAELEEQVRKLTADEERAARAVAAARRASQKSQPKSPAKQTPKAKKSQAR